MTRLCTVTDCSKPLKSDGLCSMHRERRRRHGTLTNPSRPNLQSRFWAKVEKTETCWNWIGAKNDMGYGQIRAAGKALYAHRMSFEWERGGLAPGVLIDHICHNPSCIRPTHLRTASKKTNAENLLGATMASKSGIRGVWRIRSSGRWAAQFTHHRKTHYVGVFDTAEAAESAVIAARLQHYTHNDVDREGIRDGSDLVHMRH